MSIYYSHQEPVPDFQEESCEQALFRAKWPDGFRCPRCGCSAFYRIESRKLFECRTCSHQTSLTAGTILEGTRTSLAKWFAALFLMQIGISAKQLAGMIQVTYKTAWLINHKLRHAIQVFDESLPLTGDLQVFGNFYAGPSFSYPFDPLERQEQPIVIGAARSDPETGELGKVKMKRLSAAGFTRRVFGPESFGAFIWRHAADAGARTRNIEVVKVSDSYGVTALGAIWREAVGWLAHTFGGIGPKHLQAYLDEYCFRLNWNEHVFETLLTRCGMTSTITLRGLVGKDRQIRPVRWTMAASVRSKGRRVVAVS